MAFPRRRIAAEYSSWEEVRVIGEKGRKEIHYFLKRSDGVKDLAVVAKEKVKGLNRHMSYRFPCAIRKLVSVGKKLKSRRQVLAWLDNLVSGAQTHRLSHSNGHLSHSDGHLLDGGFKGLKLGCCTKEFSWLGSPWICGKKRRHYQSFCRDGVRISVHDFVYVLSEMDERLVAYVEDMYEDSKGNKMVEARWYHKIDEVYSVLHHNLNDKEVFFSPSLQDISVECIDGLATVLSPKHYEKYLTEARHIMLEPLVCNSEFVNDMTNPFDVTRVKGYWNQEIFRYMHTISPRELLSSCQPSEDGLQVLGDVDGNATGVPSRKRLRRSSDDKVSFECVLKKESTGAPCTEGIIMSNRGFGYKYGSEVCNGREHGSAALSSKKEAKQNHSPSQCLLVGSQVEVLSQDSGLRGCWFRASVIKKHKNKVKVRYLDIQDADDEGNKLEEWLLESRVLVPDELDLREIGRTTIRPLRQQLIEGTNSHAIDVGAVVDVWWYDGWWEGIVIRKESEDRLHVYFPGEKKKSVFSPSDMRHSQEWLGSCWIDLTRRQDLVSLVLSDLGTEQVELKPLQGGLAKNAGNQSGKTFKEDSCFNQLEMDGRNAKEKDAVVVPDLLEDLLPQWKVSRKRRRVYGSSVQQLHDSGKVTGSNIRVIRPRRVLVPKSLEVDHDNFKLLGDSHFVSSSVPPLTSMVMSR